MRTAGSNDERIRIRPQQNIEGILLHKEFPGLMDSSMNDYTHKLPVGGLKLSGELVQLHLHPDVGDPAARILGCLADRHINLMLASMDALNGLLSGMCCISAEDRQAAEIALEPFSGAYTILYPVGALTIFPHRSRLELIGRILTAMNGAGLPIYGMASSFSALCLTTHYLQLDAAVSAVCNVVELPENHAPFRPEFRVHQL